MSNPETQKSPSIKVNIPSAMTTKPAGDDGRGGASGIKITVSPMDTTKQTRKSREETEVISKTVECVEIKNLSLYYGDLQVLNDVSMTVKQNSVTALIGPSGCGKSSLLRCINRMNDTVRNSRIIGHVSFWGQNIYGPDVIPARLRRYIGMVFQRSNPFPKSIFDNVAFGVRLHNLAESKQDLEARVEQTLRQVGLWEEVKDRLKQNALTLSGGQQQRLCIARTVAVQPKVILMDEPASALDPVATAKIEDLIRELQRDYTIVIVTHNLQQAGRCSDYTGFLYMGRFVEFGETGAMFSRPKEELTENYIMGRFG